MRAKHALWSPPTYPSPTATTRNGRGLRSSGPPTTTVFNAYPRIATSPKSSEALSKCTFRPLRHHHRLRRRALLHPAGLSDDTRFHQPASPGRSSGGQTGMARRGSLEPLLRTVLRSTTRFSPPVAAPRVFGDEMGSCFPVDGEYRSWRCLHGIGLSGLSRNPGHSPRRVA